MDLLWTRSGGLENSQEYLDRFEVSERNRGESDQACTLAHVLLRH